MTRVQELHAKADQFASRASRAKQRRERNTYASIEQSYRSLAAQQERFDSAARELTVGRQAALAVRTA